MQPYAQTTNQSPVTVINMNQWQKNVRSMLKIADRHVVLREKSKIIAVGKHLDVTVLPRREEWQNNRVHLQCFNKSEPTRRCFGVPVEFTKGVICVSFTDENVLTLGSWGQRS